MKWLCVFAIMLIPVNGLCDEWYAAKFLSGAATGLAIHEAGHYIAAKSVGAEINQHPLSYEIWGTKRQRAIVGASGCVANMLTTEIILQTEINESQAYKMGLLAFSIAEPLIYGIRGAFGCGSDIIEMDKCGLEKEVVIPVLLIHSVISVIRLNYKMPILPYVKNNVIGISVKF